MQFFTSSLTSYLVFIDSLKTVYAGNGGGGRKGEGG